MNLHRRLIAVRDRFHPNTITPRANDGVRGLLTYFERNQLKVWRDDARKYRVERLSRLPALASEWPNRTSRKLRYYLHTLLGSPRMQWLALHDCQPNTSSREADAIFARRYLLQLSQHNERLNVRVPIREPMRLKAIPRSDDRYRPTYAYGGFRTARNNQIVDAFAAMTAGRFRHQALLRGISRRQLVAEAKRLASSDQWTYALVVDVRNFFGSISHDFLRAWLPFPSDAIENTILVPLNCTGGSYDQLVMPEPEAALLWPRSPSISHTAVSSSGQGLPQGSSCSQLIACYLLEAIFEHLTTNNPILQWADNALMFARSEMEAVDILGRLERCLREHAFRGIPAGPLNLGTRSIRRISDGFEFLGVSFETRGDRTRTTVAGSSRERFLAKLDTRINADQLVDDGGYSSAMEYVYEQWSPQAVTDDIAEMQSLALSTIDGVATRDGHDL